MPSREVFVQEVDKLLSVDKTLVGAELAEWQPGRREEFERCIKIPLEIGGEILGPQLVIVAYFEPDRLFSICIVHHISVCRLDVDWLGHPNPLPTATETHPSRCPGPHIHGWSANRARIESCTKFQRLNVAHPYEGSTKLMAALRWFCGEHKIIVPHTVHFELPKPEKLL